MNDGIFASGGPIVATKEAHNVTVMVELLGIAIRTNACSKIRVCLGLSGWRMGHGVMKAGLETQHFPPLIKRGNQGIAASRTHEIEAP